MVQIIKKTKIMSNRSLTPFNKKYIIDNIISELEHQYQKFGIQNHSFEIWYLILMEEIAKVSQKYLNYKFNKGLYADVRKEIIQSITVLIQMLIGTFSDKNNKKR